MIVLGSYSLSLWIWGVPLSGTVVSSEWLRRQEGSSGQPVMGIAEEKYVMRQQD